MKQSAASTPRGGSGKTDRRIYAEAALPALPKAGGKLMDAAFGTELMRVTDEADGTSNGTFYSYWPTFNATSTRLLAKRGLGDAIYDFDPVNFTLGAKQLLPTLPDGKTLITEGAIWSTTDADVLYGMAFGSAKVWQYNAATHVFAQLGDLSATLGAGHTLWQMSMSDNGDVFAFTHKNEAGQVVGYVVYQRSTNRVLVNVANADANEVRIDKTGRFLTVTLNRADAQGKPYYIHDLQSGVVTGLTDGEPDYAPGHSDVGAGIVVGWDRWQNRVLARDLSNAHAFRQVLAMGNDWTQNTHYSMLGGGDQWVLVEFYDGGTAPGLFHRELVMVKTDGSQQLQRIVHHRSVMKDYWDQPRANMSRDNRFVAFTSNWGGTSRQDLFIARVNFNPSLQATPPSRAQRGRRSAPRVLRRPRRADSNH
ncbi:MAG: hypothetical protein ABR577_11900 [Pyrinomonadaceae bacterium]